MEEICPNWKALPFEILLNIFLIVAEEEEPAHTTRLTLVCKSWSHPGQAVLYSNISIKSLSQLKSFCNSVEKNVDIGSLVKVFQTYTSNEVINTNSAIETSTILTVLYSTHLPNLEEINDNNPLPSYTPTADALIDSRLKHLKRLRMPPTNCNESEVVNYITCALLMKDRLQNLYISDLYGFTKNDSNSSHFIFNRLYNKLHQFGKLTHLFIEKMTNQETQVLEQVVEACPTLKEIKFRFHCPKSNTILQPPDYAAPIDSISKFIPRSNIRRLESFRKVTSNYKMILYIMHKFPQLHYFYLKIHSLPAVSDRDILSRLFHYLSEVNSFEVSCCRVNNGSITETFASYWNSMSRPGGEHVEFIYEKFVNRGMPTSLKLSKFDCSTAINTTFHYNISNIQWVHDAFVEKNGRFIGDYKIAFEKEDSGPLAKHALPNNFFAHTFEYCPHLQALCVERCVLKKFTFRSRIDFSKRISLNQLSFRKCILHNDVLNQLSLLLTETKQLRLEEIIYLTNIQAHRTGNSTVDILMPYTKIDLFVLEKIHLDKLIYFKIFAFNHGVHYYFKYDPSTNENGNLKISNEEEYAELNSWEHVNICCQTKPNLQVKAFDDTQPSSQ